MVILFSSRKQERIFCNAKEIRKTHGPRQGDQIRKRLDELNAATTLSDLRNLTQANAHERHGYRGQIFLNLNQPYRLVIEAINDPFPTKPDGGLDWDKVDRVKIVEIMDPHE